jgi:7-cyano-7-deazaguanine synthase
MEGVETGTKGAVVLSSGGLDSTTAMAIARSQGFRIYSLSFRYGQRHVVELVAARRVARSLGAVAHKVIDIDLGKLGRSALTGHMDVPKSDHRPDHRPGGETGIPVTYVPARNTIFLSYALAWAEVLGVCDIFIGVNSVDYSGYPDCRREYIEAFEEMANLATRASIENGVRFKVRTPLVDMTKAQIIQTGIALGVDYGLTHSCYDPTRDGRPCGRCDSCLIRKEGFAQAGLSDPAGEEV